MRSTTRNTEHRNPGIGGLKAEKISTEDSSTWLATNLLAFILIPKQRNIRMLFSTPGQPHGGADSFQGDGHCHQVCCAPQVLKSVKASLLKKKLKSNLIMRRFLISGGYFGPNPSSSGNLTKEQTFLGRLLTIFQCGINYNQHGETSNFFSLRPICSSKYCRHLSKTFSGIYQAEGVIEAGKKLPIVDVGSAFYPNMVSCTIRIY